MRTRERATSAKQLTSNEKAARDELMRLWRDDWCLFARQVLGSRLDSEQEEILRAVQTEKLISVASGTARGKDYVAAVAALCFLFLTPMFNAEGQLVANTKIALTAPTGRQVKNIMMPEISRLYRTAENKGFGLPGGRLNTYEIRTAYEEWFLTGFKADEHNHEAWSGFHAVNTMFIVTEASGIAESIFHDIEGNLQNNSRLLIVFNPNVATGYAANAMKSPRFVKFRLNSLNAENVLRKQVVIPGQVDYEWVRDKVETWASPVREEEYDEIGGDFRFEGGMYRPNDLFRVKVLGMFPRVAEDILIPSEWVEAAMNRWKELRAQGFMSRKSLRLGVDVAGMGRDRSCFVHRRGNYVEKIETYQSGGRAEHMKMAGITVKHLNEQGAKAFIDTIGEGAGVYSRCEELGYEYKGKAGMVGRIS